MIRALLLALLLSGCVAAPPLPPPAAERVAAPVAEEPLVQSRDSRGIRAVQVAMQQVGQPYRFGGTEPGGFDCSGLVHYAYREVGQVTPRTTAALWRNTTAVPRHALQAGDVLFFSIDGKPSHVGLYIGKDRFVHAPSSGKHVSVQSLDAEFYRQALIRGGRLPETR